MPDTQTDPHHAEAIADVNLTLTGLAPPNAMALLELAATHSLGLLLQANVHRQQQGGITASAATVAACTRIVASVPARAPGPFDGIAPLPGPPQLTPAEEITAALARAEAALAEIKAQASAGTAAAAESAAAIAEIAKAAAASAAPTPAPPPPAPPASKTSKAGA